MKMTVIKERCPQNHPCPSVRVCPAGAIKQTGYGAPTVDAEKCTGCMKCTRFCPMGAFVKAGQ
jgi:Fe-S-cluster-containing hydrogenase component 2